MPKLPKSDGPRKVSFMLPEDEYADLALFAATKPGAPTPGPHMRARALEDAKQGKELRERLASKKR